MKSRKRPTRDPKLRIAEPPSTPTPISTSTPEPIPPPATFPSYSLIPLDLTILGEDLARLPHTIQEFTRSWNPATPFEAALINRLAEQQLRLDRCVRMETGLLDSDMSPVTEAHSRPTISSAMANAFTNNESHFMNYSRYEANLSRAFDRTLKQLLAVRKAGLQPTAARPPQPTLVPDKTNPTPIENKDPGQPSQPPKPPENRRTGEYIPFPELEKEPVGLNWVWADGRDEPHPLNQPRKPAPERD